LEEEKEKKNWMEWFTALEFTSVRSYNYAEKLINLGIKGPNKLKQRIERNPLYLKDNLNMNQDDIDDILNALKISVNHSNHMIFDVNYDV